MTSPCIQMHQKKVHGDVDTPDGKRVYLHDQKIMIYEWKCKKNCAAVALSSVALKSTLEVGDHQNKLALIHFGVKVPISHVKRVTTKYFSPKGIYARNDHQLFNQLWPIYSNILKLSSITGFQLHIATNQCDWLARDSTHPVFQF